MASLLAAGVLAGCAMTGKPPEEAVLERAQERLDLVRRRFADESHIEVDQDAYVDNIKPDGALLYAASFLYGRLHVYDVAKNREAFSLYVTPKIEGLFQTRRYLYIYGAEGVFRIRHEALRKRL